MPLDLTHGLSELGIVLEAESADPPSGPGLVLFRRSTPTLADDLKRYSQAGAQRVLALALEAPDEDDLDVWSLLRAGASDVIRMGDSAAVAIAARFRRWTEVDAVVDSPLVRENLVGRSRLWRSLMRDVVEVARFSDAPVLLLGESGTGKELIARLIHRLDARRDKKELVLLDCTTIVPDLVGSELFGHERGAFTGSVAARDGVFALADGGTLFLDEIGDLRLPLQAHLLRAIQEGTFKRVGGNSWHSTRFRLVCATHRDLVKDVDEGRFRGDLFYRIGGVVLKVPPLRNRPEDIVHLFTRFLESESDTEEDVELDPDLRQWLLQRDYPGNVRELQQLARRTCCRHVGAGPITVGDLPEDERPSDAEGITADDRLEIAIRTALSQGAGLKEIAKLATDEAIRIAVADADGSLQEAARRLGVTDRALQMRRARWRSSKKAGGVWRDGPKAPAPEAESDSRP